MESRTRSACRRAWLRAAPSLFLPIVLSCRAAPVPTLAQAFAVKGGAAARAKAFMRVALEGGRAERARSAMLWGLFACDAHAPHAALTAFRQARPRGGEAFLEARRLEGALEAAPSPASLWRAAAEAPWMLPEDRIRLRLRGAETLAARGDAIAGAGLLPPLAGLAHDDAGRALAVVASAGGPSGRVALRRLAIEYPKLFVARFSDSSLHTLSRSFSPADWALQAQSWLEVGEPEAALHAASRGGGAATLPAARAALRLHRPRAALTWAARGGERCAECWVERTEAYRQIAWADPSGQRSRAFAEMLGAARRTEQLTAGQRVLAGRVQLLLAEALTELGRFAEAIPHLTVEAATEQPRWEWVARRFLMLEARTRGGAGLPPDLARTTRGRRLAAYWRARSAASRGDRSGLEALADSGFPDLPAQWAAETLGRRGVPVVPSDQNPPEPHPPAWAADLLSAGRVADAVVAWRWELDAADASGPEWLGLVALADMPPIEAISLLVRGEPRLLSGPWRGVPRRLLESYLPLRWRSELEAAASRSRVPPWVLAGLVRQESAWNPRAHSPAGALGLTQLLPATAEELARGMRGIPPRGDLYDPGRNLTLGAALLARWRATFAGSWTAALANYNAGEKRVRQVWEANGRHDGPEFVESLEIPETWDYVHRVVLLAEGYRVLYWPEGRAYPWT
jgi:soluble lytic murein transglycosylase-like protein